MGQQRLVLGAMVGVVGLLQVPQDDIYRLQDIVGHVWILGDL
jgi:hypothetical protein